MRFIPKSSVVAARDHKLRAAFCARVISKKDPSDLEKLFAKYRDVCLKLREALTRDTFRGTYEEIETIESSTSWNQNTVVMPLISQLKVIDAECNKEATKLGLIGSEWIKICWRDELMEEASATIVSR